MPPLFISSVFAPYFSRPFSTLAKSSSALSPKTTLAPRRLLFGREGNWKGFTRPIVVKFLPAERPRYFSVYTCRNHFECCSSQTALFHCNPSSFHCIVPSFNSISPSTVFTPSFIASLPPYFFFGRGLSTPRGAWSVYLFGGLR